MNFYQVNQKLAYFSLLVLAAGIFTSVSLSAVSHILVVLPGLYFLFRHLKERKFALSKSAWALVVLIAIIFLSVFTNLNIVPHPLKNIFKSKYFIIGILSFFAFTEIFTNYLDDKKKKLLLNLFVIATTVATLSGLIALYTGFNPLKFKEACHPRRACGLYGMYMTYGYGISLFCVLLTGMLIYRDKVKQWISPRLLTFALVINLAGLFFSYCRGGWIGYGAALPFFFLRGNKKFFFSLIFSLVMLFGLVFSFNQKVRDTFLNRNESNMRRIQFFTAALYAFKERPLFGWGYKNFEPNVKDLKTKYGIKNAHMAGHAHNNFLEHLAATGIFGFLAICFFSFLWAIEMYYRKDIWGKLVFPFVVSFIISGMFQYTFGDGENLFLIMAIYPLSQILMDRKKFKAPKLD